MGNAPLTWLVIILPFVCGLRGVSQCFWMMILSISITMATVTMCYGLSSTTSGFPKRIGWQGLVAWTHSLRHTRMQISCLQMLSSLSIRYSSASLVWPVWCSLKLIISNISVGLGSKLSLVFQQIERWDLTVLLLLPFDEVVLKRKKYSFSIQNFVLWLKE